jgi:hypothetical protein
MAGLGELLDAAACGISGHIWIMNTGTDVMVCSRCHREAEAPPAVEGPVDEGESSLVPEHRPWLDAPFTGNELL